MRGGGKPHIDLKKIRVGVLVQVALILPNNLNALFLEAGVEERPGQPARREKEVKKRRDDRRSQVTFH